MTAICLAAYCAQPERHHDCADDDCRGCLPRSAVDGLRLCPVCLGRIAVDARTAASLYTDMAYVILGAQRGSQRIGAGGSAVGAPVPQDEVLEARSAIRSTLVSLCRTVAEERGIQLPTDDVTAMAEYVARHAVWLAAHPAAGEHAGDLRDVATDPRTWRVAYPSGSGRLPLGTCPLTVRGLDGTESVCGGRLVGRVAELLVTCHGCDTTETVEWWQQVVDRPAQVDAYVAAADLSVRYDRAVAPVLIRQWASTGKVARVGQDGRRTLYDLEQVRAYAATLWKVAA